MYRVVEVGSFSFPKPTKEVNEDFLLFPAYDSESNIVFAVADGVGSSNGASDASKCVIDAVGELLEKSNFSVESALSRAKEKLDNLTLIENSSYDAATTLTIIHFGKGQITIGHVGDCRAYFKKGNKLIQLTKDHTRYQELLDANEHSVRKLRKHKERLTSVITKALSHSVDLDFDVYNYSLEELTDNSSITLTLMSDGAYEHWHKRAKFSESTMNSPAAFANSLKKRIQKSPTDDFTCLSVKIQKQ
ncbi:MAG: phosphatase 2C family protein [Vibrionaceae bacterium]|nr:phosphatase 2C family protein [Vibrionaceae bacterium]